MPVFDKSNQRPYIRPTCLFQYAKKGIWCPECGRGFGEWPHYAPTCANCIPKDTMTVWHRKIGEDTVEIKL